MSKGCDVLKFVILHQFFHNQGSYSNIHWLLIEQHCLEMLHYVTNVTYRKHHCNFLGVAGGGGDGTGLYPSTFADLHFS